MLSEFWTNISQYFVGIIIVLALLFALMETSRKYDKYREWPYLVLAIGYFALLVWSLLRATIINADVIRPILTACQLAGFLLLSIGYISEGQHETARQSADEPVLEPQPEPTKPTKKSNLPWVNLLSANTELDDPAAEEKEIIEEDESATLAPKPEEKSVESADPATAKGPAFSKGMEKQVTTSASTAPTPTPAVTASVDTPAEPETPIPPTKKKTKKEAAANEPVDLSYLMSRKKKAAMTAKTEVTSTPVPAPTETKESKAATRDQMIDELFPVAKTEDKADPLVDPNAEKQATTTLPGEHRDTADEKPQKPTTNTSAPAAIALASFSTDRLIAHWPEITALVLLLIILIELVRNIKTRGHALLLSGFFLIFASQLIRFLLVSNGPGAYLPYLELALETLGFVLVGIASWLKIKGKITHHFLTVISVIYIIILILTIVLAKFIVKDTVSLQLLYLLATGTLIAMLPITHSLTYNHPAHTKPNEGPHE